MTDNKRCKAFVDHMVREVESRGIPATSGDPLLAYTQYDCQILPGPSATRVFAVSRVEPDRVLLIQAWWSRTHTTSEPVLVHVLTAPRELLVDCHGQLTDKHFMMTPKSADEAVVFILGVLDGIIVPANFGDY